MSTAEILAAARADKTGVAATPPAPAEPTAAATAESPQKPAPKKMSTAEILAQCRQRDGAKDG